MVWEQGKTPSSGGRRSVVIVGADMSGLAAAKCLLEEGLEPVVYEPASQIGRLWNYDEALPDGGGVMYRSLRTNTSRHTLAFSDFSLLESAADALPAVRRCSTCTMTPRTSACASTSTTTPSWSPPREGLWTVGVRVGGQATTETFEAVVAQEVSDQVREEGRRSMWMNNQPERSPLSVCSFCGKRQDQVDRLIAGPGDVSICNECIDLYREHIEQLAGERITTGKVMHVCRSCGTRSPTSHRYCYQCGSHFTQDK